MSRVFKVEGDVISLNVVPEGENAAFSAVLLLLYGHAKIGNRPNVMVDLLLKGLSQSGTQVGSKFTRVLEGRTTDKRNRCAGRRHPVARLGGRCRFVGSENSRGLSPPKEPLVASCRKASTFAGHAYLQYEFRNGTHYDDDRH